MSRILKKEKAPLTDKQKLKNSRKTVLKKSQTIKELLQDLDRATDTPKGAVWAHPFREEFRRKWKLDEIKKKKVTQ